MSDFSQYGFTFDDGALMRLLNESSEESETRIVDEKVRKEQFQRLVEVYARQSGRYRFPVQFRCPEDGCSSIDGVDLTWDKVKKKWKPKRKGKR